MSEKKEENTEETYIFTGDDGREYFNARKLGIARFDFPENEAVLIEGEISSYQLRQVILKDDDKDYSKYFLIENQYQIQSKINNQTQHNNQSGSNVTNLSNHIFLVKANFSQVKFTSSVDFRKSIFTKTTYFSESVFDKSAKFAKAIFMQSSYFFESDFNQVNFYLSEFFKEAYFWNTTFRDNTTFINTKFNSEVDFFRSHFYKDLTFLLVHVSGGDVNFQSAEFQGKTDFHYELAGITSLISINYSRARFHDIFSLCVGKEENASTCHLTTLYLRDAVIDSQKLFISTDILPYLHESTPHTTFIYLKDAALARHNTIEALEFHKREYEAYERELKAEKPWHSADRLLLSVEKTVSYFGTSPKRAVLYWLFITLYSGTLILAFIKGFFVGLGMIFFSILINMLLCHIVDRSYISKRVAKLHNSYGITLLDLAVLLSLIVGVIYISVHNLFYSGVSVEAYRFAYHPLSIFQNTDKLTKLTGGNRWWFMVDILNFIKTALLAFLTYEVTKSFRKFSRKF